MSSYCFDDEVVKRSSSGPQTPPKVAIPKGPVYSPDRRDVSRPMHQAPSQRAPPTSRPVPTRAPVLPPTSRPLSPSSQLQRVATTPEQYKQCPPRAVSGELPRGSSVQSLMWSPPAREAKDEERPLPTAARNVSHRSASHNEDRYKEDTEGAAQTVLSGPRRTLSALGLV